MTPSHLHEIDELQDEATQLRPAVRLTHLLFRACLDGGFAELRLVAATGGAEVKKDGAWTPIMRFPTAVYRTLVAQVETIVGAEDDLATGRPTTLCLRWRGRDVPATMTRGGTDAGVEDVQFRFELEAPPAG